MSQTMPHSDALAQAIAAAIGSGATSALGDLLAEHPQLATTHFIDDQGVGRTALHLVSDWPGHRPRAAESIALLLAAGADPDARATGSPAGRETPLHWAASADDVPAIDALVAGGADLEIDGAVLTGGTPMADAVVFAQWQAAARLREHGARLTMWQAAALGDLPTMEATLTRDGATPEETTSAFWHACRNGQRATAEVLLARGADLNWVGYMDKTPLAAALMENHAATVDWLRELGAR